MPSGLLRRLTDHPGWCAVLGFIAGVFVAAALAAAGLLGNRARTAPTPPAPAGAAFIRAWRTHLLASWSVDEVAVRTTTAGGRLRYDLHEAQRPPNSVSIGIGTVAARRGMTLIACGPVTGADHLVCRTSAAAKTWAAQVSGEVTTLAATVEGPNPAYTVVTPSTGCWELTLRTPALRSQAGIPTAESFCLDPATHALRSSRVDTPLATTETSTIASHAPATDADLALPAGASYESTP